MTTNSQFLRMPAFQEEVVLESPSDVSAVSTTEKKEEIARVKKKKKRKEELIKKTSVSAERREDAQSEKRRKEDESDKVNESDETEDSEEEEEEETEREEDLEEEETHVVSPEGCEANMDVMLFDVMDRNFISEERWLPAVLLNVKKNETSRAVSVYSRGPGNSFGNSDAKYDRIMLLGCLSTGTCFIVLNTSATKSAALLKKMGQKFMCIGQVVAVVEPKFTGKTLGKNDSLPMIEVKKPFVPYSPSKVPRRPFLPPEEPGTRFFMLRKARISVFGAVMLKGNCGGYLCDAQNMNNREKGCGCCIYTKGHPAYTLQMDVRVFNRDGSLEVLSMDNYSSWCFTNMVINGINQASKLEDYTEEKERKMRGCIKGIVEFVNNNGGWNVCGWMRRGIQIDAGEHDKRVQEEVTAESISPHIIMLRPTSVSADVIKEQMGYRVGVKKLY